MHHLLTANGKRVLDRLVGGAATLYAFDFDGTLARIVQDRHAAQLGQPIQKWLGELGVHAPIAIISGRSVEDLHSRVNGAVPHLIGNHGLEGLHTSVQVRRHAHESCRTWIRQIDEQFGEEVQRVGVSVEDKTYSLALHYRQAEPKQAAREVLFRVVAQLTPPPRLVPGKSVMNVIPSGTPHKGAALLELMHQQNRTLALYVGDDDTDEDVFSLPDDRIVTVRVGKKAGSAAQFYLESQSEVTTLLRHLVQAYQRATPSVSSI